MLYVLCLEQENTSRHVIKGIRTKEVVVGKKGGNFSKNPMKVVGINRLKIRLILIKVGKILTRTIRMPTRKPQMTKIRKNGGNNTEAMTTTTTTKTPMMQVSDLAILIPLGVKERKKREIEAAVEKMIILEKKRKRVGSTVIEVVVKKRMDTVKSTEVEMMIVTKVT